MTRLFLILVISGLLTGSIVMLTGCTPVLNELRQESIEDQTVLCYDFLDHWVYLTTMQETDGRYMPPGEFQKYKQTTLTEMHKQKKDVAVFVYCLDHMSYHNIQCATDASNRQAMLECL